MSWVGESLVKLREKRPLVHNITNYVVMNTTANALLAIGASPIMAHSPEELNDIVSMADAIVINIGTLDERWIYSMLKAARIASENKKPVILDPVGAGATKLRTEISLMLLSSGNISVVKGNYGEILSLLGEMGKTKGVDSAAYVPERAKSIVKEVAEKYNVVAGITGPIDFVSDGKEVYSIQNEITKVRNVIDRVTGLGCMVSAIIGAFLAVETPLRATIGGMAAFKAASTLAATETQLPGSFHIKLYDWLFKIDGESINNTVKINKIL
ncbi:MAG: hydroxyethylthiazole kinase [Fervidicoccaceae archaeon]